ncbi:hypothetical protein [Hymenobacter lucidus]|uniref:Uncharacterized protein n=1 Tax=Hymenobacter lucidus TaxID=2880930 RepID=A0ABS8AYZ2_9BACT|nr:hypothetical protein [Hymenobacter lucidus]MCB2411040.1 hypothetical protein [Hymenobacter lucidus]
MIYADEKNRDVLYRHITRLIDGIDGVGLQFKQVSLIQQTYLDLLRRIRCNLIGVAVQLAQWPAEPELKVPISLVMRTCLTDAITGLYLASFHQHEESFRNELHLLDRPYISYLNFVADNLNLERPGEDPAVVQQEAQELRDEMHRKGQHMFIADPKTGSLVPKKPGQLRATSDLTLFKDPKAVDRPLTESDMFHQINALNATQHLSYLYRLQRDLSQQHHYCPANRDTIQFDGAYFCAQWFKSLVFVQEIAGMLANLLGTDQELIKPLKQNQAELIDYLSGHNE